MPKHNLNDIVKKQNDLLEKLDKVNTIATIGLIVGSLALLITLSVLALS